MKPNMKTPLRAVREKRNLTIHDVAVANGLDAGNLSRIERGVQTPSKEVTERLAKYFGHEVTEMQIIFPERYVAPDEAGDTGERRRKDDDSHDDAPP